MEVPPQAQLQQTQLLLGYITKQLPDLISEVSLSSAVSLAHYLLACLSSLPQPVGAADTGCKMKSRSWTQVAIQT